MTRRPRLVASGPGMTPAARADYQRVEDQASDVEARQFVRALRFLAVQTQLWTPEQLSRALTHAADTFERRNLPERAA